MATPPNPVAGTMARSIIDSLANKGASPMQQGGITGGAAQDPNMVSELLASRMAELGGADPKSVQRAMMQMKQQVATLIPQLAFRIPGVTKHLSSLFSNIDKVLEEIDKASQTQNAVQNNPIGGGIASMQPDMGGGGGGGPAMPQSANMMPPMGQ